jgi:chromosome segregation ATPase
MHGAKDAEISTLREANATLREQLAQSVTLIDSFREERDRAQVRVDHAEAARDRAEQGRDGERARADALRDRLDGLQRDLDATRQQAQQSQQAADDLRRAEEARQGRGRWARLRAAWWRA